MPRQKSCSQQQLADQKLYEDEAVTFKAMPASTAAAIAITGGGQGSEPGSTKFSRRRLRFVIPQVYNI